MGLEMGFQKSEKKNSKNRNPEFFKNPDLF